MDINSFKGNLFNLRKQAEVYVKEHMKWRVEIKSGPRKEIPEIPVEAIREAVGNSLCHRDYTNPKGNEVAIFKDRIEIYNPGFFPDGINPEDFFTGDEKSILRNPLIAETMYRSKDIERWGSGIKRIHDECFATGVRVEFKRLKTGFEVVFYRPRWEEGEGLQEGQETRVKTRVKAGEQILQIMKENPHVTVPELSRSTGLTVKGIEWNINALKRKNLLKRVGPAKGGHWEVVA